MFYDAIFHMLYGAYDTKLELMQQFMDNSVKLANFCMGLLKVAQGDDEIKQMEG